MTLLHQHTEELGLHIIKLKTTFYTDINSLLCRVCLSFLQLFLLRQQLTLYPRLAWNSEICLPVFQALGLKVGATTTGLWFFSWVFSYMLVSNIQVLFLKFFHFYPCVYHILLTSLMEDENLVTIYNHPYSMHTLTLFTNPNPLNANPYFDLINAQHLGY